MKLPEDKYDMSFDEFYEECWQQSIIGYRTRKKDVIVYVPTRIEVPFGSVVRKDDSSICVSCGEQHTHWVWESWDIHICSVACMIRKIPERMVATAIANWAFGKIPKLLNDYREIPEGLGTPQVRKEWELP